MSPAMVVTIPSALCLCVHPVSWSPAFHGRSLATFGASSGYHSPRTSLFSLADTGQPLRRVRSCGLTLRFPAVRHTWALSAVSAVSCYSTSRRPTYRVWSDTLGASVVQYGHYNVFTGDAPCAGAHLTIRVEVAGRSNFLDSAGLSRVRQKHCDLYQTQ